MGPKDVIIVYSVIEDALAAQMYERILWLKVGV